jgi:hypothetical protein
MCTMNRHGTCLGCSEHMTKERRALHMFTATNWKGIQNMDKVEQETQSSLRSVDVYLAILAAQSRIKLDHAWLHGPK